MKFNDYKEYLCPALAKATDLVVQSGDGCYITDVNGEEYLDFVQGIAVNALGHRHPKVVEAIKKQTDLLIDASFNLVNYPTTLELAKKLSEIAPGEIGVTFFSNGGAEATDGAIKLAKNYTKRPGIIAMKGSFHGRTIGAMSVTGSNSKYRKNQEPMLPSVYFAPYPNLFRCPVSGTDQEKTQYYLNELQDIFNYLICPEDVAAILMEPVMGEGGYVVPPLEYVKAVRKICDENGILLIFDEIQSGFGRTGKWFASENYEVVPDIMTVGKAIAGGLPMSGVMSTSKIMKTWLPGMHGGTFGGHPIMAAASLAVIKELTEGEIIKNVNEQGCYLKKSLLEMKGKYPIIGDVRGMGLMVAVEFVVPGENRPNADALKKVMAYCFENKMLTLSCGVHANVMRFATPLNIGKEDLQKGLKIFEEAVKTI